MESRFRQWKKQCLNKLDLSKKGSVDADIAHIVSLLNSSENYFTTSSCSGRIIIIDGASESTDVQKQNCVWLFVSHQKCTSEELISALSNSSGDAVLKFEPLVLHVQCRRLEDAQLMISPSYGTHSLSYNSYASLCVFGLQHSVSVNSGFRNSGLTVSKAGKIIMAVRSTHGLEVPLSHQGRLLVGQNYIHHLAQVANQKMEENLRRVHRFYQNLQSAQSAVQPEHHIPDNPDTTTAPLSPDRCQAPDTDKRGHGFEKSAYTRRRRRDQQSSDRCHGDAGNVQPELEDCLDLFM